MISLRVVHSWQHNGSVARNLHTWRFSDSSTVNSLAMTFGNVGHTVPPHGAMNFRLRGFL